MFRVVVLVIGAAALITTATHTAQASKTVRLTAVINPGVLLADIRDQFGQSVPKPTVPMGKVVNSLDCRDSGGALTGTLGSSLQRIYVDNPKAAFDGWTLSIAAEDGVDAKWQGSGDHAFDYNDGRLNGCDDGDSDGLAGLLTIDPTETKLKTDCMNCSTKHVAPERSGPKNFADFQSITLLKANIDSDELGSWYITDIKIKQTIPSAQDGDTYNLDLVLTATAT